MFFKAKQIFLELLLIPVNSSLFAQCYPKIPNVMCGIFVARPLYIVTLGGKQYFT
jgi:hypothetical protein